MRIRHFIGSILLCLGIALSLTHARAMTPDMPRLEMRDFGQMPILHDGRIKPLDSFARAKKKYLSGNDKDALLWLRDTVFNPALAETFPIIKITNPDSLNMLELPRRADRLYSYQEVNKALMAHAQSVQSILDMPQKDWTQAQADIALIQQKIVDLSDLLASLSLILPLSAHIPGDVAQGADALPDNLRALAGRNLTYWDTLAAQDDLYLYVQNMAKKQGSAIEGYSPLEQAFVHLAFSLDSLRLNAQISRTLRIFPAPDGAQDTPLISPWTAAMNGYDDARTLGHIALWRDLAQAYHSGDHSAWNASSASLRDQVMQATGDHVRARALHLEYIAAQFKPVQVSAVLYALALGMLGGAALIAHLRPQSAGVPAILRGGAITSLIIGAIIHCCTLAVRVYVLQRPPVSTLFESILFVGAMSVLCGLWLYRNDGKAFWLACAGILGVILNILALSHNQDGDSMLMLSAVLNTNFWLATHVICITVGYGFCVLTSALAHYILGRHALGGTTPKQDHYQKVLHALALISLLFAAVGTILGGVWADQSWGRFWGWDPKENGALLIVLWLVWVLHGRISGQMRTAAVTSGLAYLCVVTALSWFGVNLLNVGLHSYGFTQGLAGSLALFVALESLYIGWAWYKITHHTQKVS